MKPRQFRKQTVAAYLLVPAKRVLPRRKSKEKLSFGFKKVLRKGHKFLLVWNVLNYVAHYNYADSMSSKNYTFD